MKASESEFSAGYVEGVEMYRRYPKASAMDKENIKVTMDVSFLLASSPVKRYERRKGIACAIRDCANDRKNKK